MICKHCSAQNPDHAKFCHKCGQPIVQEASANELPLTLEPVEERAVSSERKEQSASVSGEEPTWADIKKDFIDLGVSLKDAINSQPINHADVECPFCGSGNNQPITKHNSKVKSEGYNWESACCGMCLMGPFGLLCGMCGRGSSVTIKDELWWVCPSCGKEHISQQAAIQKAQQSVASAYFSSAFCGFVLSVCIWWWGLSSFWPIAIGLSFLCVPFVFWYYIFTDGLKDELGYPVIYILPPEIKRTWVAHIAGSIGLMLAVALFAIPLLEHLAVS